MLAYAIVLISDIVQHNSLHRGCSCAPRLKCHNMSKHVAKLSASSTKNAENLTLYVTQALILGHKLWQ